MSRRLSATEYAAQTGVHPDTVQAMCRRGDLVARRIGRNWQINVEASERALSLKFGNASEKSLAKAK